MKARLLSLTCYPTGEWNGADETLLKVYADRYDEWRTPMRVGAPWHLQIEVEFGTQAVIEVWDRRHAGMARRKELRGVHYIDRFLTGAGVNVASFTAAGACYELTYEVVA